MSKYNSATLSHIQSSMDAQVYIFIVLHARSLLQESLPTFDLLGHVHLSFNITDLQNLSCDPPLAPFHLLYQSSPGWP